MIELNNDLPGILAPMEYRQRHALALRGLAEVLLVGDSGLSRFERELIATRVSYLNDCAFCRDSHAHIAAEIGGLTVQEVWNIITRPPAQNPRIQQLLELATHANNFFRPGWPNSTSELTDQEIHDVVLIAAAFSMFNRYVEAVGGREATEEEYQASAEQIAKHGYGGP